jgi:hypothetical protein
VGAASVVVVAGAAAVSVGLSVAAGVAWVFDLPKRFLNAFLKAPFSFSTASGAVVC